MLSPILFLVFNRPDVTQRVFDAIRQARPPKLYIAADGPRKNKVGEVERCALVQEIVSQVDWPCEVSKLIRQDNLGCKIAVSSAIDWFFSKEPEGIILEDDCLPHPDFFPYCDELLERYRNDERVGMISGDNFQKGIKRGDGDYYFSQFCHIWGWASWARAWKQYDADLAQWPKLKAKDWLGSLGFSETETTYWQKTFNRVYSGQQDTWDYQWIFACWFHNMLAVMPNSNLISNIGFGHQATHTTAESIYANMATKPINFPLHHPSQVTQNIDADHYTSKHMFARSLWRRIFGKLQARLGIRL
ncbi:hemolytic protein HlpA-like protein [Polynucleobacter campilacus]|uniref:Hemolytic protein HlpA-like protein n=1 Tax=Polynucleobacter campilacus TaxID=1743163 RepID=A0A254PVU2_9BURK|nr:hemolytic protein HlpA-like protein [Polynucleobacter campilacus]OWS70679.1 hemolytic protein HlpA-like protein [Polynucleobacter campilacus]